MEQVGLVRRWVCEAYIDLGMIYFSFPPCFVIFVIFKYTYIFMMYSVMFL